MKLPLALSCAILALGLPLEGNPTPTILPVSAFWTGGFSDNAWSSPNWSFDQAGTEILIAGEFPGETTNVTFSATGATDAAATVLDGDYTIKSLTVNDTVGITGNQTLTVSGLTQFLNGNLTLSGGVTLNATNTIIGNQAAAAGTFNVNGASLQNTGTFYVGKVGNGTLSLSSGSITTSHVYIGASGTTGIVNVTGGNLTSTTGSVFQVGAGGAGSHGTMTISGNGLVTTNEGIIAMTYAGYGDVAVSGNGQWQAGTQLQVGNGGYGNLTISENGFVTDGDGFIGCNGGGMFGVATVSGGNWTNTGNLTVGQLGDGTLNLLGNGTVSANSTVILGEKDGATGTLNFGTFGSNSTTAGTLLATDVTSGLGLGALNFNQSDEYSFALPIRGSAEVNQLGNGTTILTGNGTSNGATKVSAGALYINGNNSAASGTVTVNGGTFGGNGTLGGNVTVQNGGTLAMGANATSVGTLSTKSGLGVVTLNEGSTVRFKIAGPDSFDQLKVLNATANGTVTLDLQLTGDYSGKAGDTFQVFQRVSGNLYPYRCNITTNLGFQFDWDLSALQQTGSVKIVLRTGPTPTPTPKPTPTPAPPSIDVGRKGNAGERFTATGGSFTLTGTGVNYNQIRWNFLKGATMKVKASGASWSVKISPLKKGVNTIQISGWNTTTNKGSKPFNVIIIRN